MNEEKKLRLTVASSPHVASPIDTTNLMRDVLIALVPAMVMGVVFFGPRALVATIISVLACEFFEWGYRKLMHKSCAVKDLSAAVTGVLLAFVCAPTLPYWMLIIGDFFAIVVVKQLFGGLGYNFANPAIVGRIAMALGFTGAMTSYTYPENGIDALASATPLAVEETAQNAGSYVTLLLGNHGGVLGETCAITLLIGGIYLIWTKVISPTIPVTYLATVAVFSLLCGYDPIYQLLSGGLILGAFFMATDYVTSPTTEKGKLVFGIGLGVITCLIRFFGTMNEGVSFAILLMNLLVPYIEVLTRQDLLGISKPKKNKGGAAK
mgnify:CR=1 FL=1